MIKIFLVALYTMMSMCSFGFNSNIQSNINKIHKGIEFRNLNLAKPYLDESTFLVEQTISEENQRKMLAVQPIPKMTNSLERKNIIKRTKLWNDPYKIGFLYIFTKGGNCVGYFVVKGKVSSVNSTLSNPEAVYKLREDTYATVSSPAEDGSYGTNGDAIFTFTQDGTYVESNMDYILVDKNLKITNVVLGNINR